MAKLSLFLLIVFVVYLSLIDYSSAVAPIGGFN